MDSGNRRTDGRTRPIAVPVCGVVVVSDNVEHSVLGADHRHDRGRPLRRHLSPAALLAAGDGRARSRPRRPPRLTHARPRPARRRRILRLSQPARHQHRRHSTLAADSCRHEHVVGRRRA